ncbi:MAG: hypothetical protein QM703_19820 [Gemmatales bacterium]
MSKRQSYYRNRQNRPFLNLERLEDRTVPAFNLTISSAVSVGVSGLGTDTITAIADDAVLNVTDLQNALISHSTVTVSHGSGGTQPGNITIANAINPNLPAVRTLAIIANDNSATQGDVTVNAGISATTNPLNLQINARGRSRSMPPSIRMALTISKQTLTATVRPGSVRARRAPSPRRTLLHRPFVCS